MQWLFFFPYPINYPFMKESHGWVQRSHSISKVFNHRWRIVQGPMAVLAGAQTAEVGLIAPVVTASTLVVVQLEASALPIESGNPVLYKARAVIHVDPTYPYESCGSFAVR
jgi:hypothetical protein